MFLGGREGEERDVYKEDSVLLTDDNFKYRLLIILWGTIHQKPAPRKSEVLISSFLKKALA